MSLKQKIDSDFRQAMKARSDDYPTISLMRAAIKQVEVDTRKELSDEDIIHILAKEAKQRVDAIEAFKKAERFDLAQKEQEEINVINKYLPEKMKDDELRSVIRETIKELDAAPGEFGKVMSEVMIKVKGRAGGQQVKNLVNEALGGPKL